MLIISMHIKEAIMHSLHHLWMKTYLRMKRLVSAQAAPLFLSFELKIKFYFSLDFNII